MTQTALKNKEIEAENKRKADELRSKEDIALKDRRQRDKESKRSTAVGGLTGLTRMFRFNDASWYKNLPEVANENAGLPTVYQNIIPALDNGKLPSLGVIYYANAFGDAFSKDNPNGMSSISTLNLSARQLMTQLRKLNSRIAVYDPSDLFQVIIAQMELFRFLTRVRRAIQLYHLYNYFNPTRNKAIIELLGFNYNDMTKHLKDYEKWISTKIDEANENLVVPSGLTLFKRKYLLDSTVYAEGSGSNAQLICCNPIETYKYNELTASLVPVRGHASINGVVPTNGMTYDYVADLYATLYSGIQDSSVLTTIIADLRSADLQLVQLDSSTELMRKIEIKPVDEVLTQLMNANLAPVLQAPTVQSDGVFHIDDTPSVNCGLPLTSNIYYELGRMTTIDNYSMYPSVGLYQDSSGFLVQANYHSYLGLVDYNKRYTIYNPHTSHVDTSHDAVVDTAMNAWHNLEDKRVKLLNFYTDKAPSSDDVLVATRLTTNWKRFYMESSGQCCFNQVCVNYSTEIPLLMVVDYYVQLGTGAMVPTIVQMYYTSAAKRIFCFNYKPTTYYGINTTSVISGVTSSYQTGETQVQQWDKVMECPNDSLEWLHNMCTKSLIYIQSLDSIKTSKFRK